MLKRIVIMTALIGAFSFTAAQDANAWIVRRVAPVRRIAARAVLPPYPIARRVVAGPVFYRRPLVYTSPVVYGAPVVYGPSVHVGVGYGYGW